MSAAELEALREEAERQRQAREEAEAAAASGIQRLREEQRKITLMNEVASAANESATFEGTIQSVLPRICRYAGCAQARAYRAYTNPRGARSYVRLSPTRGAREAASAPVNRSDLPPLVAEVFRQGEVRVAADDKGAGEGAEDGAIAMLAAPVFERGSVVAVLVFEMVDGLARREGLDGLLPHLGAQLGRVIEREQAHRLIEQMAYYDNLTGLPNRTLFYDELARAMDQVTASGAGLAVAFVDLDGVKEINDAFGHTLGDRLLEVVARRFGARIRDGDTLARWGGDEFTVLVRDLRSPVEAVSVVDRMISALDEPFEIDDQVFRIGGCAGLAFYPDDAAEPDELISNADIAMYRARRDGQRYHRYVSGLKQEARDQLCLLNDLRTALQEDQLRVYYQPQINLREQNARTVEALVRWEHPKRGLLTPGVFVPLAESSGLVVALDRWVLRAACLETAYYRRRTGQRLKLAVNVSGHHFHDPTFIHTLAQLIDETGADPRDIELELTEATLIQDVDRTLEALRAIKDLGMTVAIDDFGTGYSSFRYLAQFPVDTLKIDRTFVSGLGQEQQTRSLVEIMRNLGTKLDLRVVAEGVENSAQLTLLNELGCQYVQGFLFGRPAPLENVLSGWSEAWN